SSSASVRKLRLTRVERTGLATVMVAGILLDILATLIGLFMIEAYRDPDRGRGHGRPQGASCPVERIAFPAPMPAGFLLDALAIFVERVTGGVNNVEGVMPTSA